MRVTFVLPLANLSGGTRVIAIYADRLQRRGHEVTVISIPAARRSLLSKFKSLVYGKGWPKNQAPEPSFFDEIALPHRVLRTARPVVDDDVPDGDVVVATFWKTAPWVAALSPRKGAKAFLLQGYEALPGVNDPAIDAAWRLPLRKIVVSKWLAEIARDRFGDSFIYLIPDSVDTNQFNAPPREKQALPTVGMLYGNANLKGTDVALGGTKTTSEANKQSPRRGVRYATSVGRVAITTIVRVSLSSGARRDSSSLWKMRCLVVRKSERRFLSPDVRSDGMSVPGRLDERGRSDRHYKERTQWLSRCDW